MTTSPPIFIIMLNDQPFSCSEAIFAYRSRVEAESMAMRIRVDRGVPEWKVRIVEYLAS